jgi:hypothetical protein
MKNKEIIAYVGPNIVFGLDSWATKLPYSWLSIRSNGSLHVIKCRLSNELEGKDKLFVPKWDSFL